MFMTEYETTMVVRPDVGGDAIEATLDRIREAVKSRGGKIIAINHWGKKRLAYPIGKQNRGIYVHAQYLGVKDLVAEIERNLRISDNVMRFLTVQVATKIDPATRQEQSYTRPQYEVEEPVADEPVTGVPEELLAAAEKAVDEGREPPAGVGGDDDEAGERDEV